MIAAAAAGRALRPGRSEMRARLCCSVRLSVSPSVRPARAPAPAPTPRPPPPARAPPADPDPAPGARPPLLIGPRRAPASATAPGPASAGPAARPAALSTPRSARRSGRGRGGGRSSYVPAPSGRTAEVRAGARWALWVAPSPGQAGRGRRGGGLQAPAPLPAARHRRDPRRETRVGEGTQPLSDERTGVAPRVSDSEARSPGHRLSALIDALRGARLANFATYPAPRRLCGPRSAQPVCSHGPCPCAIWGSGHRTPAPSGEPERAPGETRLGERATSLCMSLGLGLTN